MHAKYKFYLTASDDIRAERFQRDQEKLGKKYDHLAALKLVKERDFRDKTRAVAPLVPAQEAIIIDNSLLSIDQTLDLFLSFIK